MVQNILLCGVGGQGIILASKILSAGLIDAGFDVKMSEVHGMAQRGGSVTTQVRYGEEVFSPIIGEGQADVLVSFESMETAKWIQFLKKGGKVLINDFQIPSAPILSGAAGYPTGVIDDIRSKADTTVFKAEELAVELGNIKTMNIIILGALVKAMKLADKADWERLIKEQVKPKFHEVNIRAFQKGLSLVS
ncbi:MAG: indolepyruvate oxidoreductase subunit beta [Bacillota bacterium]|nr:indolepyruvate oxidoreductase subunit beta [Bacillota bacterium]